MNTKIPQPVHESYIKHRREVTRQIILPIALVSFLVVASIVLIYRATFYGVGDVARWAAVSTIWIVIPIMIGMVIFLAILIALIYLLAKLLNIAPTYTGIAQEYVHKGASYIRRGADAILKPIIGLKDIMSSIGAFIERIKP